jgi:uncharacterized membrane protein
MQKNRLEAFSDGVIAIIITVMVLELKVPHSSEAAALIPLIPVFFSYLLSFIYIGIYWNNHHHLFQLVKDVNGSIMWANLHVLFWLSMIPFVTAWSGENHFSEVPVALYGTVLFAAATAYFILARVLLAHHGRDSALAKAMGRDFKGILSSAMYAVAIPVAFWWPYVALTIYVVVAAIWLVPDSRVERVMARRRHT